MFRSSHIPASAVLLSLPLLAGCGVIFGGTRETVQLQSSPSAATVTTTPSTATYTTPASISLERKNNYTIRCTREGYHPAEAEIQRKMRGGILALDILFTGLLGVVVDAATGGWYKLEPKMVTLSLEKMAMIEGPDRIEVAITVEETDEGEQLQVESTAPGVLIEVQPSERSMRAIVKGGPRRR